MPMGKEAIKRIRALARLLNGLCQYPQFYDTHALAAKEVLQELTRSVTVPLGESSELAKSTPEEGGWALFRSFGVLTLDGIWRQLLQSNPDKKLSVGLILVWFMFIEPGFQEVSRERLSYSKVIDDCTNLYTLSSFLEQHIPQTAEWPSKRCQWIVECFRELHEKNRAKRGRGDRTAGNYRDKALAFLLRHVERAAVALGKTVEQLLPELATVQTGKPSPMPRPISAWAARLSRCIADYRRFELSRIEAVLARDGLDPSFRWFLDRQVFRPLSQARIEGEDSAVNLTDICKPGLRTALLDHRGSGTTVALLWLSHQYCTNAMNIEPVVLRLDAREYLRYAAINESPYNFLAQKIYGKKRSSLAQREEFESVLRESEVICLVDNLARLSSEDQVRIGQWLYNCSGVVFTAAIQLSDKDLVNIGGDGTVRAALAPFDEAQIRQFISDFEGRCDSDFDSTLALHIAIRELPDIAGLPLGLSTICKQVCLHQSDCASITARFIAELLQRDGKPCPEWHRNTEDWPPRLRIPMRLAIQSYRLIRWGRPPLDFEEKEALNWLRSKVLHGLWPDAKGSPLLVQTGPKTFQFLNREVFSFLIAIASAKRVFSLLHWGTVKGIFEEGVTSVANRHYLALLESGLHESARWELTKERTENSSAYPQLPTLTIKHLRA